MPNSSNMNIDLDTELFNNGLIDSFSFYELIVKIETYFDIKIPENLLSREFPNN